MGDSGYSKTSVRAYNCPYAISFTKNREMMMVKMTKHPHLEWVDGHLHLNTKKESAFRRIVTNPPSTWFKGAASLNC
jgi:hypothetical protein